MKKIDVERPLSVGEVARRSGVSVSTLHFYEAEGLIEARRTAGNQRRFAREVLRRIAVIRVAQAAGVSLAEIRRALDALPVRRSLTNDDWRRLSESWRAELEARILRLVQLRDQLASCIGCGCLSLTDCPLRNPGDRLGAAAPGPVVLDRELRKGLRVLGAAGASGGTTRRPGGRKA